VHCAGGAARPVWRVRIAMITLAAGIVLGSAPGRAQSDQSESLNPFKLVEAGD